MALAEVEHLTFTYPEAERPALSDVSLSPEHGHDLTRLERERDIRERRTLRLGIREGEVLDLG